jgi:hypothetical protein
LRGMEMGVFAHFSGIFRERLPGEDAGDRHGIGGHGRNRRSDPGRMVF